MNGWMDGWMDERIGELKKKMMITDVKERFLRSGKADGPLWICRFGTLWSDVESGWWEDR